MPRFADRTEYGRRGAGHWIVEGHDVYREHSRWWTIWYHGVKVHGGMTLQDCIEWIETQVDLAR